MIRDYISYALDRASSQIKNLGQQEKQRDVNKQRRDETNKKVRQIRETLLTDLPPAVAYTFLDVTGAANADSFRTVWQEQNREKVDPLRDQTSKKVDCLMKLGKLWKEGPTYYEDIFKSPKIDLTILPSYSFSIQFTFTLDQPYISRDEQDFYIIDNPIRKDKILGLPYVASTSWKGSLRAALWHLEHKEKDSHICHLFGNDKETKELENFQAGRLYFYPTFFTCKSLEIINPQNRESRAGEMPIPFESVPQNAKGTFTLLYVPFDLVGEDEKTICKQFAEELGLVAVGLQAMFRTYGFGAKTSSGFGLAREAIQGILSMRTKKTSQEFESFEQLVTMAKHWSLT